jgi:hypothetical protein
MSKFNKFNLVFEAAYSRYANGGAFRENTPIKIKEAYFKSPYYKQRYSGDKTFDTWLRGLVKDGVFFFIHRVNPSGSMADTKDANNASGSPSLFLTIKTDPRSVAYATEFNQFDMPADEKYLEVLDFGINLPPVQGVPNKYERPFTDQKTEEVAVNTKLGNQPQDNSLPKKNTKI